MAQKFTPVDAKFLVHDCSPSHANKTKGVAHLLAEVRTPVSLVGTPLPRACLFLYKLRASYRRKDKIAFESVSWKVSRGDTPDCADAAARTMPVPPVSALHNFRAAAWPCR
jgi:hypothetical protein